MSFIYYKMDLCWNKLEWIMRSVQIDYGIFQNAIHFFGTISFLRSTMHKYPSSLIVPRSPVLNQPSWKASTVAAGRFQYPSNTVGPRHHTSPTSPDPGMISLPLSCITLTFINRKGRPDVHTIFNCSSADKDWRRFLSGSIDIDIFPQHSVIP